MTILGGTHRDVFTITPSYNLDLTAGPLDPSEIINCISEALVPTLSSKYTFSYQYGTRKGKRKRYLCACNSCCLKCINTIIGIFI